MSQKSSLLRNILEIEEELKKIKQNAEYRKLRKINRNITNMRGSLLTIPSPGNIKSNVTLRKDTDEFRKVVNHYKNKINVYDEKISDLVKRKRNLKKQIFG